MPIGPENGERASGLRAEPGNQNAAGVREDLAPVTNDKFFPMPHGLFTAGAPRFNSPRAGLSLDVEVGGVTIPTPPSPPPPSFGELASEISNSPVGQTVQHLGNVASSTVSQIPNPVKNFGSGGGPTFTGSPGRLISSTNGPSLGTTAPGLPSLPPQELGTSVPGVKLPSATTSGTSLPVIATSALPAPWGPGGGVPKPNPSWLPPIQPPKGPYAWSSGGQPVITQSSLQTAWNYKPFPNATIANGITWTDDLGHTHHVQWNFGKGEIPLPYGHSIPYEIGVRNVSVGDIIIDALSDGAADEVLGDEGPSVFNTVFGDENFDWNWVVSWAEHKAISQPISSAGQYVSHHWPSEAWRAQALGELLNPPGLPVSASGSAQALQRVLQGDHLPP